MRNIFNLRSDNNSTKIDTTSGKRNYKEQIVALVFIKTVLAIEMCKHLHLIDK